MFEIKDVVRSIDIRLHWLPTTAYLTQTVRRGKGVLGEYRYAVQGVEYSGVIFGSPMTLHSKAGDEIRIWIDPRHPMMSGVPNAFLKILFLLAYSLAEIGCIATLYDQWKK